MLTLFSIPIARPDPRLGTYDTVNVLTRSSLFPQISFFKSILRLFWPFSFRALMGVYGKAAGGEEISFPVTPPPCRSSEGFGRRPCSQEEH